MDKGFNSRRSIELALVLLVGFSQPVFNSVVIWLFRPPPTPDPVAEITYVRSILVELAPLAVLLYVLRQQNRGLSDIGFGFRWRDVSASILLALAGIISFYVTRRGFILIFTYLTGEFPVDAYYVPPAAATSPSRLLFAAFLCMNAIFDETLVRGLLITDVMALTNRAWVAFALSVGLQTTYHLYQGVISALAVSTIFVIFSLYFMRSRRLLPLILAHFLIDLFTFFTFFL